MADPYRIRPASRADLGAVAALEARVFDDPWSKRAFMPHLDDHFLVAESAGSGGSAGTIIGYALARRIDAEAEILDVAVDLDVRRRGIGRALLTGLLTTLGGAGVAAVFLEVRASNAPAIALYGGLGFTPVGRRRGYYANPREDAVLLRRA